ncbi:hypothetical protein [Pseudooceanicola sp. MF1-13]|uniref:hypothetical protein n=1 Tax=Pseudooceanicola sp. MF1-13 TaxID=3379095 RepID=UPI0038924551
MHDLDLLLPPDPDTSWQTTQSSGLCDHTTTARPSLRSSWLERLRKKLSLTPEQAETLARVKFPCC